MVRIKDISEYKKSAMTDDKVFNTFTVELGIKKLVFL